MLSMFRRKGGPVARVAMVVSVDEFVAGEKYDVPVELADRFILRGYATGDLSREYTPDEAQAHRSNVQVIGLG